MSKKRRGPEKVEFRLYKRFDCDLIALHDCGIQIGKLAGEILEAYARGERPRYIVSGCRYYAAENKNNIHLSIKLKSDESRALIRSVRKGYRNQFVKTLVRNALIEEPLWPFYYSSDKADEENRRLKAEVEKTASDESVCVLQPSHEKKKRKRAVKPVDAAMAAEMVPDDKNKKKEVAAGFGETRSFSYGKKTPSAPDVKNVSSAPDIPPEDERKKEEKERTERKEALPETQSKSNETPKENENNQKNNDKPVISNVRAPWEMLDDEENGTEVDEDYLNDFDALLS